MRRALNGLLLTLVAAVLFGCHPASFFWGQNRSPQDVYVRYTEGGDVRVFALPAVSSGYLMTVNGEANGYLEVLDADCLAISGHLIPKRLGGNEVVVPADGAPVIAKHEIPSTIDDPQLPEVTDRCGSTR